VKSASALLAAATRATRSPVRPLPSPALRALLLAIAVTTEASTTVAAVVRLLLMSTSTTPAAARALPAASGVRLSNRELRHRARHDRLTFGSRQRRANQRPANRAFFVDHRSPALRNGCRGFRLRLQYAIGRYDRRPDRACRWIDVMAVTRLVERCGDWKRLGLVGNKTVIGIGVGELSDAGDRLRGLQAVEHLGEKRGLRSLSPLGWHFSLFVLMFCVADDAAGLFDVILDHRDDCVIGDTALARTVVVQHVAGPKPALLHALPRKTSLRSRCRREIGHRCRAGRQPTPRTSSSLKLRTRLTDTW
jgi:hypothetical protein